MLNIVQLIMVLVIVVGTFVSVKIPLQFFLQSAILCFCRKHIRILHRVGGRSENGNTALYHNGAGGHNAQEKGCNQKERQDNQSALPMPSEEPCRFFRVLSSFFCRLRSFLSRFCGGCTRFPGFRRHIFLFNGSFLLPTGIGVTGKLRILPLCLFVQSTKICFVCRCFCMGCVTVRFELMGVMCGVYHPHTALGNFLHPVSAFYAHIIFLRLPDFPVSCR